MPSDINLVETLANTVQNTSPVTAFFMGAASLFALLNKRIFVTNEMATLREENAALRSKVEYLEKEALDTKTHIEKLEARFERLESGK